VQVKFQFPVTMNAFLIKNKTIDLTFCQTHSNGRIKAAKVFVVDSHHTNKAKETFKKFLKSVKTAVSFPPTTQSTNNRHRHPGLVPLGGTRFELKPATINAEG